MKIPGMFEISYDKIVNELSKIDPVRYAESRNFTDGAVTRLSPYISRGVISVRDVARAVLQKQPLLQCRKLLQELAWREYFQRVWQARGDEIFSDLKQPQGNAFNVGVPKALTIAQTGIEVIDDHLRDFYRTGYLHNHLRMYIASCTCNLAGYRWQAPSRWMYYHLLDGDLASNTLSWQWVAGSFSSKKYLCNQDNVNRYTKTFEQGTFIDGSYESLPCGKLPDSWQQLSNMSFETKLPLSGNLPETQYDKVFVYNSYNLDPLWRANEAGLRVCLFEPGHFDKFPVSEKVITFLVELSANIPGVIIQTCSFENLKERFPAAAICFKAHPSSMHYSGSRDEPDWLFPEVSGYYPSFSAYWKKCEKWLPGLVQQFN